MFYFIIQYNTKKLKIKENAHLLIRTLGPAGRKEELRFLERPLALEWHSPRRSWGS